ncbi:hypothetical protein F6B41_25070 [Microbacterium lushaniae]|nr:hypothetical protein F6B41_30315 [Microbacterium lushaniae]KAA9149663.1 hypothetical protein F6B41_25070 [Microbacterium lushaniae]
METTPSRPSATEAQAALDSVAQSRQTLAPYVRSPWWLYPAQGLSSAALVIGLGFTKTYPGWASGLIAAAVVLFCALPLIQQRAPGRVALDVYTHPGSRGVSLLYVILFGLVIAATLVINALVAADWIVYIAAVVLFVLTVAMGPVMDARLERALRAGA